jgi:hypothetical protein
MKNPKDQICEMVDALIIRIQKSGQYITEDAKMDAKRIKSFVQELSLNPNIYNDN